MRTLLGANSGSALAALARRTALLQYADQQAAKGHEALDRGLNDRAAEHLNEARMARLAALAIEAQQENAA